MAKLQRQLSRRQKFSKNWQKHNLRIQKQHQKIADVRKDSLHKHSTAINKNHAMVAMEDLNVCGMSACAIIRKAIFDQGWYEFRRQIGYKLIWLGGIFVLVPPQNTSLRCYRCGCVDRRNRRSQAEFQCVSCGHVDTPTSKRRRIFGGRACPVCVFSGKGSNVCDEAGTRL